MHPKQFINPLALTVIFYILLCLTPGLIHVLISTYYHQITWTFLYLVFVNVSCNSSTNFNHQHHEKEDDILLKRKKNMNMAISGNIF